MHDPSLGMADVLGSWTRLEATRDTTIGGGQHDIPQSESWQPGRSKTDTITGGLGVVGARFVMAGGPAEGRFSLVEHPIVPRGLAAPVHLHTREDEFSFVLEGRWGFMLGPSVVYAELGDLVYKPRKVWHTFWNATDRPARLLEIISPAGFEQLFVELTDLLRTDPDNVEAAAALGARYGLESDPEATARVAAEHGLVERLE